MNGYSDETLFLSVGDAAQRLGTSRMRIREAIAGGMLPAQRDNAGNWRVRLDPAMDTLDDTARQSLSAEALIELLFDEVQELRVELAHKDRLTGQLCSLLERQQALLDRAISEEEGRSASDEETGTHAETEAMRKIAGSALDVLDETVDRLASRTRQANQLGGLLERSLDASGRLEGQIAEQGQVIEKQEAVIDRLFTLAESTVEQPNDAKSRNGGTLGWLFGRARRRE